MSETDNSGEAATDPPIDTVESKDDATRSQDGIESARASIDTGDERPIDDAAAPPDDDEIPLLTEILPAPERPRLVADPGQFDEASWNRMALKVEANVMQRMLRHADRLVDGPLVDRLDALLDRSAERLIEDIRSTLRDSVREAISRSIAEELGKARATYKRNQS